MQTSPCPHSRLSVASEPLASPVFPLFQAPFHVPSYPLGERTGEPIIGRAELEPPQLRIPMWLRICHMLSRCLVFLFCKMGLMVPAWQALIGEWVVSSFHA